MAKSFKNVFEVTWELQVELEDRLCSVFISTFLLLVSGCLLNCYPGSCHCRGDSGL